MSRAIMSNSQDLPIASPPPLPTTITQSYRYRRAGHAHTQMRINKKKKNLCEQD